MQQHTKTSYHPYLLVAFYLNCLPKNILQIIPRSTKFDWNHRDIQDSFGYDWFLENKNLFHTLQMVALQSLRTVGIESIRIFVFSGLKKSPKEFNLFFAKRPLCYIFFKEKGRRS